MMEDEDEDDADEEDVVLSLSSSYPILVHEKSGTS